MMTDDSPPIPDAGAAPPAAGVVADETTDLPAVRDLILAAYPDVVPDLVAGTTVAALLASVEGARAAYAAVEARIAPAPAAGTPLVIPAGGGAPLPVDPDRLPASEKIRRGLRAIPTIPTSASR